MPQTHEYKLIISSPKNPIQEQLSLEGRKGWKPILLSTPTDKTGTVHVYIVLEHALGS
jgi:hypothetical protein